MLPHKRKRAAGFQIFRFKMEGQECTVEACVVEALIFISIYIKTHSFSSLMPIVSNSQKSDVVRSRIRHFFVIGGKEEKDSILIFKHI